MSVRSKNKKPYRTKQIYSCAKVSASSLFGAAATVILTATLPANAAMLNANAGSEINGPVNNAPVQLLGEVQKPLKTIKADKKTNLSKTGTLEPLLVSAGMPIRSGNFVAKNFKAENANIKTIIRRDEEEKIITSWLNEDKLRKQVNYVPKKVSAKKTPAQKTVNEELSPDLIKKAEPASIIDRTKSESLTASQTVEPKETLTTLYAPEVKTEKNAVLSSYSSAVSKKEKTDPWKTAQLNVPSANYQVNMPSNNLVMANVAPETKEPEYAKLKPLEQNVEASEVSAQDFVRTFAPMYPDRANYEEAWENRQEAALWSMPNSNQQVISKTEENQITVDEPIQKASTKIKSNEHKWISIGANVSARPLPVAAKAQAADPKVEEFLAKDSNGETSPSWLPNEETSNLSKETSPVATNVDEKTNQEPKKSVLMPLGPTSEASMPMVQQTPDVEPFFASETSQEYSQDTSKSGLIDRVKSFFSSDSDENSSQKGQAYSGSLASLFSDQAEEAKMKTPTLKKYAKQRQETATMPSEIKITFPKGSSDVSAATVKWLKAFSAKAAKDSRMIIEIKMSNIGLDMQGRRFAIIRNILTSNDVPVDRINPVLTTRNPDTIILKTSIMPQEDGNIPVIDAMGGSYLDANTQK